MKLAILGCLIGAFCIFLGYFAWRYTPVRIKPGSITKVLFPVPKKTNDVLCDGFTMTPAEFADYFAHVKRLTKDEEDEYGYGGCFYEATIEGRRYRIWIAGLAQIKDGASTEYYGHSSGRVSENP
jgi:hypothetical protein